MEATYQQQPPVQRPRRVFISYRRSGGIEIARGLYEQLRAWGYDVFIDLEGLRAGAFNQSLYQQIKNSDVFLLVLTKGCLDRCRNSGDWVRQELSYAILCGLNIVPVMHEDFSFPRRLPQDIAALRSYQGLRISYEFYDAFLSKLAEYINTDQVRFFPQEPPQPSRTQNLGAIVLGSAALVAAAILITSLLGNRRSPAQVPDTTGQAQQTTTQAPETTAPTETTQAAETTETTADTLATEATQAEETETLFGNSLTNLANESFMLDKGEKINYFPKTDLTWTNCLVGDTLYSYWYDSAVRKIYAENVDNDVVPLLEDITCRYLYVTDQWLYCALCKDDITSLYRAKHDMENRSIGELELLVEDVMAETNRIAIRDGYIYYWIHTEGLYRCRTDGTDKQLLYREGKDWTYVGWRTFHVSRANLYFIATRGVWSVPVTGGSAKAIVHIPQEERDIRLTHAVAHNEKFYYVIVPYADGKASGIPEIWCSETTGENMHMLCSLENENQEVQLLNVVNNSLYLRIAEGTEVSLYKIPLVGAEIAPKKLYDYSRP